MVETSPWDFHRKTGIIRIPLKDGISCTDLPDLIAKFDFAPYKGKSFVKKELQKDISSIKGSII